MKKTLIIASMLGWMGLLVGCDDNEEPTTFQGKVVFPENDEQSSRVKVRIAGYKSRGTGVPVDNVADTSLVLDESNRFQTIFSAIDVQYYKVAVDVFSADGTLEEILLDGDGIECSPYSCNTLEPGKSYDLTIRIVE